MLSVTKQAISNKLATTVGHYYVTLTLQTFTQLHGMSILFVVVVAVVAVAVLVVCICILLLSNYNCFPRRKLFIAFPKESQLRQSRAIQPVQSLMLVECAHNFTRTFFRCRA